MSNIEAIFIDDGGVMNDNNVRGPQWQRLVAMYLAPRLGGDHSAWEGANAVVFERQMARFEQGVIFQGNRGFLDVWQDEDKRWLREMCELVGVDAPSEDERCWRLAREVSAYVTRRLRTAFPGAVDALKSLYDTGYRIYTASGSSSLDLDGFLTGMTVRPLFNWLYGPDLVNTWRGGPLFYDRIFADAGVSPSKALVVDDSARAVEWASEAGAATVLVSTGPPDAAGGYPEIAGLRELPSFIERYRS